MSLKPKKKSDAKKIKAKMKARESRMGTKEYLPQERFIGGCQTQSQKIVSGIFRCPNFQSIGNGSRNQNV